VNRLETDLVLAAAQVLWDARDAAQYDEDYQHFLDCGGYEPQRVSWDEASKAYAEDQDFCLRQARALLDAGLLGRVGFWRWRGRRRR
jgi:hypothetical protein